jgi:hypothetical protein
VIRPMPVDERTRRVARVWKELEPTPTEVARARARFTTLRRRRGHAWAGPAVVLGMIVLCASMAFAARRVVWWRALAVSRTRGPDVSIVQPPRTRAAGAQIARPATEKPAAPPPPPDAVALGRESPAIDVGAVALGRESPAIEESRVTRANDPPLATPPSTAARTAVRAPKGVVPIAANSPTTDAPHPTASRSAEQDAAPEGPWTIAAEAMRRKDYATAEHAFDALASSRDPRTRDEARLARAQLWIAQGRSAASRRELEGLAEGGATEFVRRRAADTLRRRP